MVLKERGCRSKKNSLSSKLMRLMIKVLLAYLLVSSSQPAPSLIRTKMPQPICLQKRSTTQKQGHPTEARIWNLFKSPPKNFMPLTPHVQHGSLVHHLWLGKPILALILKYWKLCFKMRWMSENYDVMKYAMCLFLKLNQYIGYIWITFINICGSGRSIWPPMVPLDLLNRDLCRHRDDFQNSS